MHLVVAVSNAAVNPYFGPILDCPESTWDKIFEINVKTAFLLFKGTYLFSTGMISFMIPYARQLTIVIISVVEPVQL